MSRNGLIDPIKVSFNITWCITDELYGYNLINRVKDLDRGKDGGIADALRRLDIISHERVTVGNSEVGVNGRTVSWVHLAQEACHVATMIREAMMPSGGRHLNQWKEIDDPNPMSQYLPFDQHQIDLEEIDRRGNDLASTHCANLDSPPKKWSAPHFLELILAILTARRNHSPVIAIFGGHPIKLGLSRYIIDLIERGLITHVATNGAGIIHDFELALVGGTSEDVARWINVGQFGLWQETSRLNDIISEAAKRNEGLGEAVGRVIEEEKFPHRDLSIAAAGWRCGVPVTCHVTIGGDIIHAHPNCNGAALGQTSYTDFLIFAQSVYNLEGGVFLNIGSAVTGPEVYLKALSMARNLHRQEDGNGDNLNPDGLPKPRNFTTAVFDLVPLPPDYANGPPSKDEPLYYYRPWKTILCRTVADGGKSFYFQGDHRETIPALWWELTREREPASALCFDP